MSVSGDMAASLVSRFNFSFDMAQEITRALVVAATDANFASRFAVEFEEDYPEVSVNDRMLMYWDVMKFLESKI